MEELSARSRIFRVPAMRDSKDASVALKSTRHPDDHVVRRCYCIQALDGVLTVMNDLCDTSPDLTKRCSVNEQIQRSE